MYGNRWITTEISVQWLKHFIATAKHPEDKKVLTVLDGLHSIVTKPLNLPVHSSGSDSWMSLFFFKFLSPNFH
jgi:hypothetical protein